MVSSSPKVFMFLPNKLLIKAILDIIISKDKVQISKNILNAKVQRRKEKTTRRHGGTEKCLVFLDSKFVIIRMIRFICVLLCFNYPNPLNKGL
jgi:hypothetical protein